VNCKAVEKNIVVRAELCLLIKQKPLYSSRNWLLGDHLGSTSKVTDASGGMVSEVRYSAFGETRYQNGTLTTDYLYTGQRQETEIGLYYYVARWYDPAIGRFIQADSIVPDPGSALGFDRFGYSYNNPLKFTDPTGNTPCLDGDCTILGGKLPDKPRKLPTRYLWSTNPYTRSGENHAGYHPRNLGEELTFFESIANQYTINLPPSVAWNYTVVLDDGVAGANVVNDTPTISYDHEVDDFIWLYDEYVYMGDEVIKLGYTEVEIASVMAEEARHAWQEYFIENGMNLPEVSNWTQLKAVLEVDANTIQINFLENHNITSGDVYEATEMQLGFFKELGVNNGLSDLGLLEFPYDSSCNSWVCRQ